MKNNRENRIGWGKVCRWAGIWIRLSLFTLFILTEPLVVEAAGQSVTLRLENVSLKEAFKEIKRQLGYRLAYNEQVINAIGNVSVDVVSGNINEVMEQCLRGSDFSYEIENQIIVIYKKQAGADMAAPQKLIKLEGVVVDSKGGVLPGVTVVVKGTTIGVATDIDGKFSLEITETPGISLEFSFVGMNSKEIPVKIENGKVQPLRVVLEEAETELDEVVVTGMFSRKKEGFTGSAVTVKGDELKKISTTSIAKALSTIEPSFRIMENISAGSDPNRLPDMRMRGSSTLPAGGAGDNSLVSLQGEYDTYPNQPLLILDGFEIDVQTMVDLDPDRVQSITMLKDASATAIYGSKASNGVIVIETYTPKPGEINVSYGGNLRLQMPDLSAYNLMDAEEKIQVEALAGLYSPNDLDSQRDYQNRLREVKRGVDTYWLSQPLRTAVQHRHALTLEGGSEALRYKLYLGLNQTPGVMKESRRSTQTAALDLSYRYRKLLMKNSLTVDNSTGDDSPYGSFSEYTRLNPYLRPYGENGEINKIMQTWDMIYLGNSQPYQVANPMYNTTFHSKDRTTSFSIRNLFKLEYTPTDAWRLQADISIQKSTGKDEVFRPAQHTAFAEVVDPTLKGDFKRNQSEDFNYMFAFTASYNNVVNDVHYLTGNLRYSVEQTHSEVYGATVTGFPNGNMDHILFGKKYNENMTGSEGTTRALGAVATLGYSYDYRYSADFNIRIDGSSQFGKDNRFAPFWSAGLRWNMKKESWLRNVKWVDDVVLRASYGVTGTQGFSPYQSRSVYTYTNLMKPYFSSNATGTELVALGNSNLKWQQTGTWKYSLELSLLKGRFTTRAEYYIKNTKNSLAQITLAPSVGFASYPENMGNLETKGVELNFSFIPYRNLDKDAYWVITVNGSHNEEKLKKISDALRHMNELNTSNEKDKPLPMYEEGESQTRIWVVRSLGIDPMTGDELLLTRNGKVTSEYNAIDKIPYGDTEPKWQGNINTAFNYKGFGANLSFNYKFGGQVYNQTLVDKIENADLRYNVDKRVLQERWQKPGDVAKYKRLTNSVNGSETRPTSRFVMDENTLTFGSLSLTYRMDQQNTRFLKKSFISSLKWGFTMEDIFYLSSVKQERGLDYPFARQFAISLNVVFK